MKIHLIEFQSGKYLNIKNRVNILTECENIGICQTSIGTPTFNEKTLDALDLRWILIFYLFRKRCLLRIEIDLPTKSHSFWSIHIKYPDAYSEVYQPIATPSRHQEKSYVEIHLVGINHAVKTFGSESDRKNRNWKCNFFLAVPLIPLSSPISERILRIRKAIPISRTDGDIAGASFDCGAYEMLFFMLIFHI